MKAKVDKVAMGGISALCSFGENYGAICKKEEKAFIQIFSLENSKKQKILTCKVLHNVAISPNASWILSPCSGVLCVISSNIDMRFHWRAGKSFSMESSPFQAVVKPVARGSALIFPSADSSGGIRLNPILGAGGSGEFDHPKGFSPV